MRRAFLRDPCAPPAYILAASQRSKSSREPPPSCGKARDVGGTRERYLAPLPRSSVGGRRGERVARKQSLQTTVLLMDRDPGRRRAVSDHLANDDCLVVHCGSTAEILDELRGGAAAAIVIGCASDGRATFADLPAIHAVDRRRPIVLLMSEGSEHAAIEALRAGAKDYFSGLLSLADLSARVRRHAAEYLGRTSTLSGSAVPPEAEQELLGDSGPMSQVRLLLARVAVNESNVLLTGETGTGKELAARFVHRHSPRRSRPFVSINCAAIPEGLLESELFGYERGAFTGAHATKAGQLQLADGGTVFFDEIGDLGALGQAKILRAIEDGQIARLGGRQTLPVDLRIVAATNHDLERAVDEGRFRKDLYFRLNVARVHMPPLRERRGDLRSLLDHYITVQNRRLHRSVHGVSDDALATLEAYDWPGNVRELKNVVESIFLNRAGGAVSVDDLPELLRRRLDAIHHAPDRDRERLLNALAETRWNVTRAAEKLRWSRMTIYRKMARYHIVKSDPAIDRIECHPVTRCHSGE